MNSFRIPLTLLLLLIASCAPLYPEAATPADGKVLDIAGRDWRIIRGVSYDVVFPDKLAAEAKETAALLDRLFRDLEAGLNPQDAYRYTIILDNANFTANGYVSILPRLSVYYSLPIAGEGTDWYTLLAIHEGRHMRQIDAGGGGTVRLLTLLFGEQGLIPLFAAPAWFFEGDAVMSETLLTTAGRGRDPAFTIPIKAMVLDGEIPSYQTALLGSYRQKTPDPYNLGYLLYAHLRTVHEFDAPATLFESLSLLPLPLIGAWSGVRTLTGASPAELYRESLAEYGRFWRRQTDILLRHEYRALTAAEAGDYRVLKDLQLLDDGGLAAAVFSLSRGGGIEILDGDGILRRRIPANPASRLSSGGALLAWDESVEDVKFDRSASRIVLYDRGTGLRRILLPRGRWTQPELSPDGRRLAVLEWREDFSGTVKIFATADGSLLSSQPIPEHEFWYGFDWAEDGMSLLYLTSGSTDEIRVLDIAAGTSRTIRDLSNEIVYDARLTSDGGTVYSSSWSGVPSVYRIGPDGGNPELISAGRLGRFSPRIGAEGALYFIDYSGTGGAVVGRVPANEIAAIPLGQVPLMREEFFAPLLPQQPGAGSYDGVNTAGPDYGDDPYSFAVDGFRLHSWSLLPSGPDPLEQPEVALRLRADTLAKSVSHELSGSYNLNSGEFETGYALKLRRRRPELTISGGAAFPEEDSDQQYELDLLLEVPWGTNSSTLEWYLAPLVGASAVSGTSVDSPGPSTRYGGRTGAYRPAGPRNLQPRWGAEAAGDFEHYPLSSAGERLSSVRGTLYLPGLFFTHGLALYGAWEEQNGDFTSRVPFARGWSYRSLPELAAARLDYRFPLAYPDLAMGGLILFKRVRAGLFADHLIAVEGNQQFSSVGGELQIDFNLLQLPVELSAGLRGFYRVEEEEYGVEILILGAAF